MDRVHNEKRRQQEKKQNKMAAIQRISQRLHYVVK